MVFAHSDNLLELRGGIIAETVAGKGVGLVTDWQTIQGDPREVLA